MENIKQIFKTIEFIIEDLTGFFFSLIKLKDFKYVKNVCLFHILWERNYGMTIVRQLNKLSLFYPYFIEIEVTTRCNLKCLICEHTYWKEPPKDMSFVQFKSIIDQFPNLCWIGLTGIGESFLNKDFLKMLEYVKRRRKSFIELYDTFFYINEKIGEKLVDLKVDRIFVSLDAATKETYEKIRVGSDFYKVIKNIEFLFKKKKETNSEFPRIDFHFIVNKLNYSEIPEFIELVNSLRNGFKTTIQFTRMLHDFPEVNGLFIEIPSDIIKKAEKFIAGKDIQIVWNQDVPKNKPSIKQCTAWSMPFIFVNGDVISCCASNEANKREFQKKYKFGNVFEKSFKEIWFSENYTKFRYNVIKGKTPLQCKDCPIFLNKC